MMTAVTLDGYFLRVRQRNKSQPLPLGNFGNGANLPRIIIGYLRELSQDGLNVPALLKSARVDQCNVNGTFCNGLLRVGAYGYDSDIVNTDTGALAYKRQKPDADMVPYFFDFCMPERAERGVVLLQRFGLHGVKSLLKHVIVDRFRVEHDKYIVDLNPLVPAQALRQLLDRGQIQRVRFIKHGISPDVADRLSGVARQRKGELEYSVTMHEKGWLPLDSIFDYLEGQRHLRDVYEIPQLAYDNMKIEITIGERQRTLDLGHPDRLKASFDVTHDILEGADGFPTFDSISTIGRQVLTELANDAGILR